MAATKGRLTKFQQEQVREAIKTTQLVKRLQFYALEEKDPASGKVPDLDSGKLKAIDMLLKKTVPDLASVQLTGDEENPVVTKETGQGAAKLIAMLDAIDSRTPSEPE